MPSNQREPSKTVEASHMACDVGPIRGGLPEIHSPSTKVQVVVRGLVSTAMVVSNESARSQIPAPPAGQAEIATGIPFATKGSRQPKSRKIRSWLHIPGLLSS